MSTEEPRFRRAQYALLPGHFAGHGDGTEEGEKALAAIGVVLDMANERSEQGLYARFPTHATPTALATIGRDRKIRRGKGESNASYAARLIEWRLAHKTRGSAFALLRQIRAYFANSGGVACRTVDMRGNWYSIDYDGVQTYAWNLGDWNWDDAPPTPNWARFWVIIYTDRLVPAWNYSTPLLGDPTLWGGALGNAGYVLGMTTAQRADFTTMQLLCREWKPAGTFPEWLIFTGDPTAYEPGVTNETDGTWGNWSTNSGGTQVPTRASHSRFARIFEDVTP